MDGSQRWGLFFICPKNVTKRLDEWVTIEYNIGYIVEEVDDGSY